MNKFIKYVIAGAVVVGLYSSLKPEYESIKGNNPDRCVHTDDLNYYRRGHGPTPPMNWRELESNREEYVLRKQLERRQQELLIPSRTDTVENYMKRRTRSDLD